MKLTTRSEYALLAMVYLGRQDPRAFVSVGQIAGAQRIPRKYLEQILLLLKKARLLRSRKGQQGGYQLARLAAQISLAEVIRLMDGALAPTESVSRYFYEPTPIEGERGLLGVFKDIRDMLAGKLERTTLAQVARHPN
jgi:Rrf2 family transcriptional regulator, cysteine metabolism repressor